MLIRSVEGVYSPENFAAFQRRAEFILKNPFLSKEYTEKERIVLNTIANLQSSDFSDNIRQLKVEYPADLLDELIKRVMRAAGGRTSIASTVKSSSSQSPSSRSSFSSEEENFSFRPCASMKVDPVAGVEQTRPPLTLKSARTERRAPSPPMKTSLIETESKRSAPDPVMSSPSLEEEAIQKGKSFSITQNPVQLPGAAHDGTLLQVVSPQLKTNASPRKSLAVPAEDERSLLAASLPVSSQSPVLKKPSFIETGSAIDLLKSSREYNIALQGAVCLKYLFPEIHQKLFPKEEDQKMVDAIIKSFGLIRFVGFTRERAIDEAFKGQSEGLFSVLQRLGKKQTLSKITKPPNLKEFPPLAPIFYVDPRLAVDQLPSLIEIMGKVRYQCLGIYTVMSNTQRRSLNCFCSAVFVQEVIGWPLRDCLQAAFRGKYPSDEELDGFIREVTLSDSLSPLNMPEAPKPERSIEEVFAYPFLKYPILFKQLLKHLALFRPDERFSFFGKQIEAVQRLKEQALFSHAAAVERCFARSALEKHFTKEKGSGLIEKTLGQLERLSPRPMYNHPLLKTEEGIAQIGKKCQGDLHGYIQRVEAVLRENPGIGPFMAVQAVFSRTALRLLFESDNDYENGKELDRMIEQAVRSPL